MKKSFLSLALVAALVFGGVASVSAAGYGNGAGDETRTRICTNADCENNGEAEEALSVNRVPARAAKTPIKAHQTPIKAVKTQAKGSKTALVTTVPTTVFAPRTAAV